MTKIFFAIFISENGIFTIKGQKKIFAKKSVKNLKNAQKYSKNNGEGPNLIGLTFQKLLLKNYKSKAIFKNDLIFAIFLSITF